jgi:hypothetical protein
MTVVSSPCQRQRELLPSFGARRLSTIYRTRGEYANHYATDAVPYFYLIFINLFNQNFLLSFNLLFENKN